MVITINQKGLKYPYYLIKEVSQVIFVVPGGKNGVEYNKTICFFSSSMGVNVYQCLYGQGILLMQRNDEVGEAKELKVITLAQGKQVEVPAGLAICIINVGRNFLVVHGPVVENEEPENKTIIERHGLVYYVIEKKGEIAFEQNPNYRVHPQISSE